VEPVRFQEHVECLALRRARLGDCLKAFYQQELERPLSDRIEQLLREVDQRLGDLGRQRD
jgi:hypothetical protein